MMHLALYRKYRPETFADVVGQEKAVLLLTNSIKQNKIDHAYLFCGGRGTGKTSVARIVARDIGCNGEDIIEIDAASNRGIDEIRDLREAVRTMPFSSPYKVYIIDEAHMLTKEAANALLKTLEEPPSHVVFILATTDPDKLPQTIVSRCQKVIFNQPDVITLSKRLQTVAEKEGVTLPPETATLLARHGNNSYRDALGYLEQALRISKDTVDHNEVLVLLGIPEHVALISLLTALCTKDKTLAMTTITSLEEKGISPLRVYDELLELIRIGLLLRVSEKSTTAPKELLSLVQEHPQFFVSKHIFELLKQHHLLTVSSKHAWTAVVAIMFSLIEG